MAQNHRHETPRPEIQERGIRAEKSRVHQLHDRANHAEQERGRGVRYAELVDVVDMREPEDERREEEGCAQRRRGEEEERQGSGAE